MTPIEIIDDRTLAPETVETRAAPLAAPMSASSLVSPALSGLSWGLLAGVTLAAGLSGLENNFGVPQPVVFAVFAFLGFALISLFEGLAALLWKVLGWGFRRVRAARAQAWLRAVRPAWVGRLVGAGICVFIDNLFPESPAQVLNLAVVTELYVPELGVTGLLLALARLSRSARAARPVLVGAAVLLNGLALGYFAWRGEAAYAPRAELAPAGGLASLALPDPGAPGAYVVQTLTYGSGLDRHRPEFGAEAVLTTPTRDATPIFAGYDGAARSYFEWYWGFGFDALPLNGRVWYPAGDGPFPVVLAVHGNHAMTDFSDPGYAYLGEHLASRGYVFVSVDENFLNGFWLADGEFRELPIRAWLLLEHLAQLRAWNADPASPFYGKVDLGRVGLIGHSRGGEAVAVASELNERLMGAVSQVADDGDYSFGIRGVVAIAPSDNHFQVAGAHLVLKHSSYLLLIGGHDHDTFINYGAAQYHRVRFDENPGGFAAQAYLYRANHGQFNTVWADRDRGALNSLLLNRAPYLSGAEQRQAARVFITAFLEAALNGQAAYRAVFYRPAAATQWLPEDLYVTGYHDDTFIPVQTNDRGSRRDSLDLPEGAALAEGVTDWKQIALQLRDGTTRQGTTVQRLAWDAGARPTYRLHLPGAAVAAWGLTGAESLSLALGTALQDPLPYTVQVTLETADGARFTVPLTQFGALHPPLPARQLKQQWYAGLLDTSFDVAWPAEYVLQTYDLPLGAFAAAAPGFDPAHIAAIELAFDGPQGGAVFVDTIGFRR
jgi:dienelactone hydrolase